MVVRALFFVLLCACSNDEFNGQDAGDEKPAEDVSVEDVAIEGTVEAEAGPTGFCATQTSAVFFCDDFDVLPKPSDSWSVTTPASPPPGAIDFGKGLTDKGLTITAAALATAYITKQVQGNALHAFAFAMQLPSLSAATSYVRVQAQSSSFVLATDALTNFTAQGDTGGQKALPKPDTGWHTYDVVIANGNANITIDGKSVVAVPFGGANATSSSLDVGVISGALGGSVSFDDVTLR